VGIDVKYHDGRVSVVSLASMHCTLILDALVLKDAMRRLLQPLLAHEGVVKVFHGNVDHVSSLVASYDIEATNSIFNTTDIANYFATHCDALEDERYSSLHALCAEYLEYELDKTSPQANRGHRPLSSHMIHCAAIEVSALVPLQHAMVTEWEPFFYSLCFQV